MKITTEKIINKDGDKCFRILKIEGFKVREDLPKSFFKAESFYSEFSTIVLHQRKKGCYGSFSEGDEFLQEVWEKMLTHLIIAGSRLLKIEAEIEKKALKWKGQETHYF